MKAWPPANFCVTTVSIFPKLSGRCHIQGTWLLASSKTYCVKAKLMESVGFTEPSLETDRAIRRRVKHFSEDSAT